MKLSLCLALLVATPFVAAVNFSGDALRDFDVNLGPTEFPVVRTVDPSNNPDVGVPPQIDSSGNTIAGWDMRQIFWQYNPDDDRLAIGIDCYVICGDADGDGNPDDGSPALDSIGGQDTPDISGQESFAIAIDWRPASGSGTFDPSTIIGIPGGNPANGSPLPCAPDQQQQSFGMATCFGFYTHARLNRQAIAPAFQFLAPLTEYQTINHNPSPSNARPDLEWSLNSISDIRARFGTAFAPNSNNREPWGFDINAFAGSFTDAGIGEDYIPDQFGSIPVDFPCLEFDPCDVCLGDGSTCEDCLGIPAGNNDYDICDVCGGDGTSCLDCAGIPNGPSTYDECDVCNGDGTSCIPDCLNIPGGRATYDVCDVCDGDGSSCLDCAGIPNGATVYDVCDICGGDGTSCLDCADVPNGAATYDVCDVCGGDGSSCLDCLGNPNGPAVYDACDICDGNSDSCLDCLGVPNGRATYDICDVCAGDGSSCIDCAGVPFGAAKYDLCGVCEGDGNACRDCRGIPFGPNDYDQCGVCRPHHKPCYYYGYDGSCHHYGYGYKGGKQYSAHHDDDDDERHGHGYHGHGGHHSYHNQHGKYSGHHNSHGYGHATHYDAYDGHYHNNHGSHQAGYAHSAGHHYNQHNGYNHHTGAYGYYNY